MKQRTGERCKKKRHREGRRCLRGMRYGTGMGWASPEGDGDDVGYVKCRCCRFDVRARRAGGKWVAKRKGCESSLLLAPLSECGRDADHGRGGVGEKEIRMVWYLK